MELLNGNTPAIAYSDFVPAYMTDTNYKYHKGEGNITVHGRGGNGNNVFIEYLTLPPKYKKAISAAYGWANDADMWAYLAKKPVRDLIKPDYKAIEFFNAFRSAAGNPLTDSDLIALPNDAAILNAVSYLLNDKRELKRVLNVQIGQFWDTVCTLIKELKADLRYKNSLPTSERRLKPIFNSYCATGYASLIPGSYGNNNSKVHGNEFTHLILSLFARPGCKPYAKDVHEDYKKFMAGKVELIDMASGEMFDPANYTDEDGQPITISQTQVWNIINKPSNRSVVDSIRNGSLLNSRKHNPLVHRHGPQYASSKITMDDVQFPFKLKDGEAAVGYRIFDVASGCIIGKSYGKSAGKESGKDRGLFMEAIKDMFRLVVNKDMGIPAEIEVEHHISNTFKDDILKEGYLFPFVRFCLPGNPREKRAEHNIKAFKYQQQHKQEGFHGRFYGRNEANVPNADKQSRMYSFEELIANDEAHIAEWHNSEHPKHPGMTRWEVFTQMQNPNLSMPNLPVVAKCVGEKTRDAVQIYNDQWFHANNAKYQIPSDVQERLTSRYIMPYWIPAIDGSAPAQVYVYQNDKFLCACDKITTWNEAQIEQTDEDIAIKNKQLGYRKQFDTKLKERKAELTKVKVAKPYTAPTAPVKIVNTEAPKRPAAPVYNADYWKELATADL